MITIDHVITAQLWDDPYFWEQVPWASIYREAAEEALAIVDIDQSTLSLKQAAVYNQWQAELTARAKNDPQSLESLISYIHCRRRRKEPIRLKGRNEDIVIWDGDTQ